MLITKSFIFSPFLDGMSKYIALIAPWLSNMLKFKLVTYYKFCFILSILELIVYFSRFVDEDLENKLLSISKTLLEKRKETNLQNKNIFDLILMNRYIGENEKIDG